MDLTKNLKLIYKENYNDNFKTRLEDLLNSSPKLADVAKPDQNTIYLITYGDIIKKANENPLKTLHNFLNSHFKNQITDVHLLPMFPYSSDDGFSVIDYEQINPELGTWKDINTLSKDYRLMFDFVVNHISQESTWFKAYLNDEPKYRNYFIPRDDNFDYSKVVRPRTSPLISTYENEKTAWTTFSKDQVDLNFQDFEVLYEMTKILIDYIQNGATSIRLDAIGFLYKKSGTSCIHLDETHAVVKLWREILDEYYPNVQIITETNVPHKENISYYGNSEDEANQVYQFALPTLTLHTYITGDVTKLVNWAQTIKPVSSSATYFNFLASHDGIGMRPSEGILDDEERNNIFDAVAKNGALFNYKNNVDGTKSVYEINITYFDAIRNNRGYDVERFIGAHALLLSLQGVPAIYYHSLLGSTNDLKGAETSEINRRINRQKFTLDEIEQEMKTVERRKEIISKLSQMIEIRKQYDAFDPYTAHIVEQLNDSVIKIIRQGKTSTIECYINVSENKYELDIKGTNLLTGNNVTDGIGPYEVIWIKND